MSFLSVLGNLAPLAGLIPGIGPVAAGAIGAAGKLIGGGSAGQAAESGLGGAAGSLLGGAGGIANALKGSFGATSPSGAWTPDVAKILAGVGGVTGAIGNAQQRNSAQNYNNAQIQQRNQLMSQILSPKNYGFQPNQSPNLNAQANTSSAPGY